MKKTRYHYQNIVSSGYSLIELLVVIVIFAILAVVGTQIVTVSVRNSNKSESLTEVRENVDYIFNVVSRELQNAQSIDIPNSTVTLLQYYDADGAVSTISCASSQIRVNGVRITGTDVQITCTNIFAWEDKTATTPYSVTMTLTASDPANTGVEGSSITTSRRIVVRSF